jgi:Uma2 family endonuclease
VIYPLNMRTKVAQTGLYTYPDIVAVCGEPQFEDENLDTLVNPALIIEVLSESTERYDRGSKFARYRSIATLREYVMVSQWERSVERFLLREDGTWDYTESTDPNGSMELTSIACSIPLSTVYHKVDFERVKRPHLRGKES